jgi:uncharacterized protein (TIGR03435 family)
MKRATFAFFLASCAALGQTPGAPLSFEVASIRPVGEPPTTKDEYSAGFNAGMRAALSAQGLRIRGQNASLIDQSLRDLIRIAYGVKDYQISAPGWLAETKFDIQARMPAGASRSQASEMLRTLLGQRFHLRLHRETRKMTVYALVRIKDAPALAPSAYKSGSSSARPGRLQAYALTMGGFADLLAKAEGRPVVDFTGVAGLYDFDLTYTLETDATDQAGPSLATALREKLGLRLERRQAPVEVLVVDQADKVPTEN